MSIWYNPEKDEIYLLDDKLRMWFSDYMYWKTYCARKGKERRIRTKSEMHERLWESGYEYLGELIDKGASNGN